MTETVHLDLPFLDAAQAQKHVTHNEALQMLDALVHLSVSARGVLAPPATPVDGQRLLLGANATDAFAGKDMQIATFVSGGWIFLPPKAGWRVYVESENVFLICDGAKWVDVGTLIKSLQNLALLGLGTTADANNPLSVKANAALFTAKSGSEGGSGDLRFTLNKSATGATVSQLYQSNWSGRAETGLSGDDRFRIKVSNDGSNWKEALIVDPATGAVVMPFTSVAPFDAMASQGLQINGAMEVSQINGGNLIPAANGYVLDGWQALEIGAGVVSAQQVADAPPGFSRSLKIAVTSPQATLSATDYLIVQQPIEGARIARLSLGTAGAAAFSVGFYFKSTIPGAFYVTMRNAATNRSQTRKFNYAAPNVWQWISLAFSGDVAGVWTTGAATGLLASITLACGAGLQNGDGVWLAANALGGADQTNGLAAANSFQLTGFCLFPGTQTPTADTAWNCRPQIDDELRRCHRYLRVLRPGVAQGSFGNGVVGTTTSALGVKIPLSTPMRAAPTPTQTACSLNDGSGWRAVTALTNLSSPDIACFNAAIAAAGLTVGRIAMFGDGGTNTATLTLDARL